MQPIFYRSSAVWSRYSYCLISQGAVSIHMLGANIQISYGYASLIGSDNKSLHIALSGVSLVFGIGGVAIGHISKC